MRSRRRVALTDAGKRFLPKAAKLLQDAEDAMHETRAAIQVASGSASGSDTTPRTTLHFRMLYPEVLARSIGVGQR